MKIRLIVVLLPFVAGVLLSQQSCSTAGKAAGSGVGDDVAVTTEKTRKGILAKRQEEKAKKQETIEELKEIANSDYAMLPFGDDTEAAPPTGSPVPQDASPAEDVVYGTEYHTTQINIGDIFSSQNGMSLAKELSVADTLAAVNPSGRTAFLNRVSSSKETSVPMTISQSEIGQLKQKMPGTDLPSVPVSLQFQSTVSAVKKTEMETALAKVAAGLSSDIQGNEEASKLLKMSAGVLNTRVKSGEKLFLVTRVSRSQSAQAKLVGQSVSDADVAKVRNAVEGLVPMLKGLKAEKSGDGIRLSQDGGMTWTFEASPLRYEAGRLRIDETRAHSF